MLFSLLKSALRRRPPHDDVASSPSPEGELEEMPCRELEACSDEELMRRYAAGEARAFDLIVSRYERPLYGYILRSVKRQEIAEELLQEVFIRVLRNAATYQQSAKFTTWLYTIARNICIDRARKHNRRRELSLDESVGGDQEASSSVSYIDRLVDEDASVSHMSHERRQFLERLEDALQSLPEEQREVFLLKEVSGLKFREIAELVGAPVPTIKSRMRYALQALRGHLEAYRHVAFDEEERMEVTPG